ncbi:MAG: D-glycero-beta-D-manno-heptose-7-phosphate kinase [Acidobacteriaceae bacterium]|nr:D-glycero-beta-D-manno-heptose-7-phosphate kinase [Acidobacteriaceae bacterium]MBV9782121.1 D-glycero-beta-D-manno-heptose-7-phosphate kinase [Acidobacteriaceae bacterium]
MLIVGDVMLDEHILGDVRRLSPEAPVPIVEIQSRRYHPGGAANVAANINCLHGSALLVGIVGADAAGSRLTEELASRGVSTHDLIPAMDRRTTTKSRVMAGGQHIVRFDEECQIDLSAEQEELLATRAARSVEAADACIISDYAKGVATPRVCHAVISAACAKGIPVVVDPKGADYSKYMDATVITPNLKEARAAAGTYDNRFHNRDDSGILIEDIAATIMKQCPTSLLITRGAQGMTLFERGAPPVTIRARTRQVYDVTGAGDTVVATLALGLAAGLPMAQAARLGNLAAGIVVGELGASTVSIEALQHAIAEDSWSAREAATTF